ncbi:zinc-dependent metalloprotease family protein [Arthrobacter luteolus]|uniref:zinc-dependent metalloprotease family protein n=1 Tax=Arthrobacter luteolus TaxID=98672 RepID=UPI00082E9A1B|nr:zinc-dependent metalloprotease family protein [Arthrobacter luteolus]
MKTGKLALLAALMSALTLGGLAAPAAALAPTVQATDPADGSEIAVDPAFPAPSPPAAGEGEPDGGSAETIVPSPEVPVPPAAAPTSDVAAATTQPPADEETSEPDDDGFVYVPVGEGHVVPGPDTPLITEADGSVRSAVETEEHEQAASTQARGGAASMLSAAARAGNIKVTLVRATVQGNGNLVNLAAARNSVSSANSYWKAMSNNRLSMSIVSEKVHYSASAHANDDYATMMNKIARELKWVDSPYTALVVFVPTADLKSGGYGGILGGGWTTGGTAGRILMPAPSSFTNNVVTHEVGHVLGLLHANSLQCTNGRSDVSAANGRWTDGACSSREYGDTTDLMGSAQYYHPVINAYFWDAGGFGRGNEILNAGNADGSKTYTLTPWGGTAANRAVKFRDPQSGETYYIELRQPVGYDEHLQWGSAGNRGIKIVKADAANSWAVNSLIIPPSTKPFAGYYNTNHAWQAGQTFSTHTGVSVKINSVSSTSASITISAGAKRGSLYFNGNPVTGTTFGVPTDQFLTCDWDGDGQATPATFFRGIWTISNNASGTSTTRIVFGDPGDQPICGDWDGDGKDTIGVYRNGTAYLKNTNSSGMADGIVPFGNRGDTAVIGDWNGDGYDTLGVARGEGIAKRFFLTNSNIRPVAEGTFLYGNASDTPVAGDWDRDGYSTVGVQRGNYWHLSNSNIRVIAHQSFMFGDLGDKPLTGRWARNGGTGVGVAR